jgi:hypothetical protein
MACFHPVASVTLGYVLGYIDFHVGPPEILFHVLVHLGTVGMNREFGHMSLIKDCLLNICIDRHHKAFSKSDHILLIPLETRILRISLCQFMFDDLYVFVIALSSDNSIIKIRFSG